MSTMKAVFGGLLAGCSGYALFFIVPNENPYAFTACALSLCHGLLSLIDAMSSEGQCSKSLEISSAIMEIVPLPLVNIELYLASSSNNLALGHGIFIIPLVFDLIAKLFTEDGEDPPTETLKDLTILGNIVSLIFLSVNEENALYGGMAATAFMTKYGSMFLDNYAEGSSEWTKLMGQAVFNVLTKMAVVKGE